MNVAWDYRRGTAAGDPGVWIDPTFAQAGLFADTDRVASVLTPAFGLSTTTVEIMSVSYVPRRALRVVYRLISTADETVVVRVDFMAPATVAGEFARARDHATDASRVALLEEWAAVAWRVPEDARLPALETLLAPSSGAAALTRALGTPVSAGDLSTRLLSYVPRRRAVLRFDGGGTGGVVVKVGRMRDEDACHRRQVELFLSRDRGCVIPRPLGIDATLGMRVEEAVDGAAIEDLLGHGDLDDLVGDVGTALAALHRTAPAPGLPRIGSADLMNDLDAKTLARLTATLPRLAPRITGLADRLRASQPVPDRTREVTLHGDFHPANLVIGAQGPVFIDLDNVAIGPPERDLAIFAGRLILMGLKRSSRADAICAAALELPDRYSRAGGATIRRDVFDWYLAASILARQIANAVRRLAPGLATISEQLLDIADMRLAGGRSRALDVVLVPREIPNAAGG